MFRSPTIRKHSRFPKHTMTSSTVVEDFERARYYLFDWDNNVLHMPTKVYMEELLDGEWTLTAMSTDDYSRQRHLPSLRPPHNDWKHAFTEFSDRGERGTLAFRKDLEAALDDVLSNRTKPAASFEKFKKCLIEGRLFAIITARGHSETVLREGVEYFVKRVLTDAEKKLMVENLRKFRRFFDSHRPDEEDDETVLKEYFDFNRFYGVSNPEFKTRSGLDRDANAPELGKKFAIQSFVRHVVDILKKSGKHDQLSISVGFSDDDKKNIEVATEFLQQELSMEFPSIKFVVYDTSDVSQGEKKIVLTTGALKQSTVAQPSTMTPNDDDATKQN